MICGETKSGFHFEVDESAMNDMELIDALADDTQNEFLKVSRVLRMIMTDDQRKKLYDHLRNEAGKVPADAVILAVMEIFQACGQQGKKRLTLIWMLRTDRDALICDLAETYGIFDYRALPVPLLATLASGLREDSRIKMRLSGQTVTRTEMLLAAAVDRLSFIRWAMTEDGANGVNYPKSILDTLLGIETASGDVETFREADDFESAWAKITGVRHE